MFAVTAAVTAAPAFAQRPSALERALLDETNRARTTPAAYAEHLEEMLSWFEGTMLVIPNQSVRMRTVEGATAVREAIAFLKKQPPRLPMTWSDGLWRAARDHAADQGLAGTTGHDGTDGSSPANRMERHGRWLEVAAENIDYGSATARETIISLIVDDGVLGRGHRTTIFSEALRTMGAACGAHPQYRRMCVIDYAGGFAPANSRPSP
jgi:uncharacterized protein YkwD